jgi:hypothetical protein
MYSKSSLIRETAGRHWALVAALAILAIVMAWVFFLCLKADSGHFIYALDDAYIHMAVAKNFALHGVWGVTPYGFASAESSIIWPLLISLVYRFSGPNELTPLVLNILAAVLILFLAYRILSKAGLPQGGIFTVLLAIVVFVPLPAIVFTGMEHTLQVALAIPFIYLVAEELAKGTDDPPGGSSRWLWALAPLQTLTRYEGLFLAFAACLLFLLRRRWRYAFGLGALAIAPVAIIGAVSRWKGWFWLPNSIYLKAYLPRLFNIPGMSRSNHASFAFDKVGDILALAIALLVLLALLVRRRRKFWTRSPIMIVLFLVTSALDLRVAAVGWFSRYEAYLVVLGLLVLAVGTCEYLSEYRKGGWAKAEAFVAALWILYSIALPPSLLCVRSYYALRRIPLGSRNIYEQQYQIGLFLRQFYRGASVAANDIGAVCYLGDPHLEDLWGLGSSDAAKERTKGYLSPEQISYLTDAHRTKIAVLHERLFTDGRMAYRGLPSHWKRVGRWTIPDNYIAWDATVSFFAVDPSEEARLADSLRRFSSQLPGDIQQDGLFTQTSSTSTRRFAQVEGR